MAPKYKLTYFNLWGRGEALRLTFAAAGVAFEDKRISFDEWGAFKPKTPRGYMPVLEIEGMGGKMFSETIPLFNFLAREFGLDGKTNMEKLIAQTIVEENKQIREAYGAYHFAKDDATKAEAKTKVNETLLKVTQYFEDRLTENKAGKGFLVGNQLTWADIAVYDSLSVGLKAMPDLLEKRPKLAANRKLVESLPKIAQYLKTRPKCDI